MSPAFSTKATAPAARAARRRPPRTLIATTAQPGLQGDGLADGRPYPGIVICHQQPDRPNRVPSETSPALPDAASSSARGAQAGIRRQVICSASPGLRLVASAR